MPLPKTHNAPVNARHNSFSKMSETNGAVPQESRAGSPTPASDPSVTEVTTSTSKSQSSVGPATAQTHGAVLPAHQHITSVDQLLNKRRGTAKGCLASFDTVAAYHDHLSKLTPADLSRHAIEEAKIVPISDRSRLIKRLEAEFVAVASRTHGHPLHESIKTRTKNAGSRYTEEQNKQLTELKKKMGLI